MWPQDGSDGSVEVKATFYLCGVDKAFTKVNVNSINISSMKFKTRV